MIWKKIENKQKYALGLLAGLFFVGSSLWITVQFVPSFETREGFIPFDPFMDILPPIDVSTIVFCLLYSAVLSGFFYYLQEPKLLLMVLFSFGFMYWFRTACISLVPFNEPLGLIPLSDPFIEALGIYQTFVKRDLFFSGHFASVFIPYLLLRKKAVGWIFALASVLIGLCVMLQHIHYSYDVVGAIPFCYMAVVCAEKISKVFYPQTEA